MSSWRTKIQSLQPIVPNASKVFTVGKLFHLIRVPLAPDSGPNPCLLLLYFASSRATLSSTPLMNCTDSGVEKRRAISSDSLMMTGRGVSGKPRNSATPAAQQIAIDCGHALHAPMLGVALDELVDLLAPLAGDAEQLVGESRAPFRRGPCARSRKCRRTCSRSWPPMSS